MEGYSVQQDTQDPPRIASPVTQEKEKRQWSCCVGRDGKHGYHFEVSTAPLMITQRYHVRYALSRVSRVSVYPSRRHGKVAMSAELMPETMEKRVQY